VRTQFLTDDGAVIYSYYGGLLQMTLKVQEALTILTAARTSPINPSGPAVRDRRPPPLCVVEANETTVLCGSRQ